MSSSWLIQLSPLLHSVCVLVDVNEAPQRGALCAIWGEHYGCVGREAAAETQGCQAQRGKGSRGGARTGRRVWQRFDVWAPRQDRELWGDRRPLLSHSPGGAENNLQSINRKICVTNKYHTHLCLKLVKKSTFVFMSAFYWHCSLSCACSIHLTTDSCWFHTTHF